MSTLNEVTSLPFAQALAQSRSQAPQSGRALVELLQGHLRGQLTQATRQISEGMPMSQAMDGCGLTTPVSSRMLRVGERTGQMGEMMERIAQFYDSEISQWIDMFVKLFEPLLMAFIGLVIGFIVVVMYFPIFELAGSIR